MKRIISLALLLLTICTANAQVEPQRTCETVVPSTQWDNWFNSKVDEYKADKAAGRIAAVNYTLPVIVHVLHNGDAIGSNENISYAQIQSQLAILNTDFAGTNTDITNIPSVFQSVQAGNTGISFCLAKVNPSGTILSEPGVERINWGTRGWNNPGEFVDRDLFRNYINSTIKPASIWDPSKYLNIWIVDASASGLLGFASFPMGSGLNGITLNSIETQSTCGVVVGYTAWGNIGTATSPYNKGRTATHEIGHWLGLRHIWGDGDNCRGNDDYCGDTPPQKTKNEGCKTHPYNLGVCTGNTTGEMFMNYMDYSNDACMYMFTQDQADRMQTAMLNGVYRNPLSFSTVCQTPSIVNDVRLNANVVPSSSSIIYGSSFSVTTNFVNRGNSLFNGDFCAAVFDNNNNFISFIQTLTNYSLQVNNTYVNNQTFSTTGILDMIPGNYKIGIFYRPTGGGWLQCGNNGSYVNLVPITVINPKPIELYSTINVSAGNTITQGQASTVIVDVTNTGSTTFTGQYQVNLYNLDGTLSETINTITESNGLQPNYHYNSPYLVFSKSSIVSAPGEYLLAVMFKTASQTSFELAGSTYFSNPIRVSVLAPSPDQYEINNTFTQSYSLPLSFSTQTATVNTIGSNFHSSTDEDYYKITFPPGYNYSISARLHDSYSSGNGFTYSVDSKFKYSTNGGVTWSSEIDDIMTGNITANGGGTIYFHVSPYFAGNIGTYLLDMNITRTACPSASITPSGSLNICSGNSIVLTSNNNLGNQWYKNGTLIPGATGSTYTATTTGVYTVITTTGSCASLASNAVTVNVNPLPTSLITASGSTTFCSGGSVVLNANTGTGLTYQWKKNGVNITSATASSYSATDAGSYTVVVTNSSNCSSTSNSVSVTVNSIPSTPTISATGATTFCQGSNVILNSNIIPGLTYQWKKDGANISGATASSITATVAGSYTVVVTNSSNCSSTSNATIVTVNNLPSTPSVVASGATNFCQGGSVTLTSSSSNGNQWYNNGTLVSVATGSTFSATATGVYTVITTTGSCASLISNAVTVTANVLPSSVITAAGPTAFCVGGSVVLNANTGTGLTYQWKKDGTNISGATSSSFTATIAGSYTVLVTNSSNCSSTSNATIVTVNNIPTTPTLTATGNLTFCQGGSVTLTSSSSNGNQWYNNGTLIPVATGSTYLANGTGVYTVTTTTGSCASPISNAITVTVNALPSSVITAAGPTAFCVGGSVVLNANTGTGLTYQWKKDGTDISGVTASSFTATVAGSYTVLVTNSSNCSSTSNATIVTIGSIPTTPSISWNGTQLSTTATGVSYQWFLNGNVIPGATSANHSPTSIGVYKVTVTANGCSNTSDNYTLVVTGIDPTLILSPYTAQVYPNPAKNDFAIKFGETPNVTLDIQLINNLGIVLKSIKTKNNLTTIKVNELPSGLYFIKIIGGAFNQVKKIEIIK
jgi:hypothetical protein